LDEQRRNERAVEELPMRLTYRMAIAALPAAVLISMVGRVAADTPSTSPATREATSTYTFRGHTLTYPASWRLREKGNGAPATIYKPAAAADALTASWDFDRKTDRAHRTAEQIRDDVLQSLATTMKGFEMKEKGRLTIDGKAAAFVTFAHSVVNPPAVSRHVFIPTGDGFVIAIDETAVASVWVNEAPRLARITDSLRFPR
jgi:hypothetical protein